ncbi:MAG: HipA family kinase, partial [Candidatus Latescibacterota bacterium]|nr:HipA family kinase [Candidatus Latescibacterota bacterium]
AAQPYPGDGDVWRAVVHTCSGKTQVMLKLLDPRRLFIECLCALVGRNMGLPIPKPYLIHVTPAALGQLKLTGPMMAFGSELVSVPSLARAVRSTHEIDLALQEWSLLQGAIAFDELIANSDRNATNILISSSRRIHLIDHDQAIPSPLDPTVRVRNELLHIATRELRAFERRRVERQFSDLDLAPCEAAVSLATSSGNLAILSQDCRGDQIHQFLLERIQHVKMLILEQLKARMV